MVLLGALSAFGPLSMDMYLPGLPSMARDLSAPAWAAQLTITTSMLGLAGGQLVAGPISDALGRRRPLLTGVAAYMVASLLCAVAPTIWLLLAFRLVQGIAGAAGIVIARAIVRDLHTGVAAARFFALLMLVGGLAPILAPLVGGALLHVTDWRGIFVVLAGIGAVLLLAAWAMLAETLPPAQPPRRRAGGNGARLRRARARPGVPGLHALGRAGLRRDGDLHLRLAVRAAGHPRRLAAAVQRALRAQRHRDHGRQPGQPLARRPLRPARDAQRRGLRSPRRAASACSSRWSPTSGWPACSPASS